MSPRSGCGVLFARVYCHARVKGSYRFYSDLHIVRKYLRTNMCAHTQFYYTVVASLSRYITLSRVLPQHSRFLSHSLSVCMSVSISILFRLSAALHTSAILECSYATEWERSRWASASLLSSSNGSDKKYMLRVNCSTKYPGVRPGNTRCRMQTATCWTNTNSAPARLGPVMLYVRPPFENYDCINITMIVFMCVRDSARCVWHIFFVHVCFGALGSGS